MEFPSMGDNASSRYHWLSEDQNQVWVMSFKLLFSVVPRTPKTLQELDGNILLLKIPHTWDIEHE